MLSILIVVLPIVCTYVKTHQIIHLKCMVYGGLVTKLCLTVTLWTVALQAPLSMEFSRQEYWRGLTFPSLHGVFLTQEWNLGLLLCRQILYQLSYEGSPSHILIKLFKNISLWKNEWTIITENKIVNATNLMFSKKGQILKSTWYVIYSEGTAVTQRSMKRSSEVTVVLCFELDHMSPFTSWKLI